MRWLRDRVPRSREVEYRMREFFRRDGQRSVCSISVDAGMNRQDFAHRSVWFVAEYSSACEALGATHKREVEYRHELESHMQVRSIGLAGCSRASAQIHLTATNPASVCSISFTTNIVINTRNRNLTTQDHRHCSPTKICIAPVLSAAQRSLGGQRLVALVAAYEI